MNPRGVVVFGSHLWGKKLLYSSAHCADCKLCLTGHDVGGLDVAVIHGVLKRSASIGVLVAHVTIEGDFGSSPETQQIITLSINSSVISLVRDITEDLFFPDQQLKHIESEFISGCQKDQILITFKKLEPANACHQFTINVLLFDQSTNGLIT